MASPPAAATNTQFHRIPAMHESHKISLVIPCYNEETGLGEILRSVPSLFDEVIVVDNASTDRTSEVARSFGARVVLESRKGYGQAYAAGFNAASGDIIVTMDGDNSYPARETLKLVYHLTGAGLDFISGCRFPLKQARAMSLLNRLGNSLLTALFNILTLGKIKDSQSGMWAFKRAALKEMRLKSRGMAFSQEIKMEAVLNKNIVFAEVPIDYSVRLGVVKLRRWEDGTVNLLSLITKRIELLSR